MYIYTYLYMCVYICLTFSWKDNDDNVNSHNIINNNKSNDNQFVSKLNYQIHSCALMYTNECKSC